MNKNILKVGALALGLFASAMVLNGAKAATGDVSLTITTQTTACAYGTSLNLGTTGVDALLTTGVTLSNSFGGAFNCSDYLGSSGGWNFTIQTTNLTNQYGNTIDKDLIAINHAAGTTQGDSAACTRGFATGTTREPIGTTGYSIIYRTNAVSDKVCDVTVPTVSLKVDIPAYQAPGSYSGTLTLTLPIGFTTK